MKKNTTREGWEFEELEPSLFETRSDIGVKRVWRLYRCDGELIKEEFYYNCDLSIFLLAHKKNKENIESGESFEHPMELGQPAWQRSRKNGEWEGPFEQYHSNGKLAWKKIKNNGEWEGPFKKYNENGQIIYDGKMLPHVTYGNEIRFINEGPYKKYYENGQLEEKGTFKIRKRNKKASDRVGPYEKYYENGQLKEKGTYLYVSCYENEKEVGPYVSYYENGQLKEKGTHEWNTRNEKEVGPYVSYYENGQLEQKNVITFKCLYENGRLIKHLDVSNESYHKNGQLWVKEVFQGGGLESYEAYNEEGQIEKVSLIRALCNHNKQDKLKKILEADNELPQKVIQYILILIDLHHQLSQFIAEANPLEIFKPKKNHLGEITISLDYDDHKKFQSLHNIESHDELHLNYVSFVDEEELTYGDEELRDSFFDHAVYQYLEETDAKVDWLYQKKFEDLPVDYLLTYFCSDYGKPMGEISALQYPEYDEPGLEFRPELTARYSNVVNFNRDFPCISLIIDADEEHEFRYELLDKSRSSDPKDIWYENNRGLMSDWSKRDKNDFIGIFYLIYNLRLFSFQRENPDNFYKMCELIWNLRLFTFQRESWHLR